MINKGKERGFTLVELISVMVLIGILSVAVLPRFFEQNVFAARGFFDETKALLRYAQKVAVAQRRTVCVALAANGVALAIDSNNDGLCNASDNALALPSVPRGGNGLAPSVAAFRFNSLGGTNQAADVVIAIADANGTITVDAVTGHVY